jgi:serine/threonine protein kinase
VPLYEAGEVGPFCYLASAYCPGLTLSEWLKEHAEPVPVRLAARLVAALADAVAHAHQRGVIHRELKPSNILLQHRTADSATANRLRPLPADSPEFDFDYLPRITDFGLAKLVAETPERPGEEDGAQTRSGQILGTPNYMAPEQAGGKNKEIGPAADVSSLGAILYELLTGRPPFRGDSLLDTLEQVRQREPLPPSRLRPKLPRDVETICLQCLQKEPRKRYTICAAIWRERRFKRGPSACGSEA